MSRCWKVLFPLTAVLCLLAGPGHGWEDLECTFMGGTSVQRIPSTCEDRCDWAGWVRENGEALRTGWGRERTANPDRLVPVSLVLCAIQEWACSHGFSAAYDCNDRISLEQEDGPIHLSLAPAYRDFDTGEVEALAPPGRSYTRNPPGQTLTHTERVLGADRGTGVFTSHIVVNRGLGNPGDCVWERREVKAVYQIGDLVVSGGYTEQYNASGGCVDSLPPGAPERRPFVTSPGEFESLFMDLVEHLIATSERLGRWLDTGELPGAAAVPPPPAAVTVITVRVSAPGRGSAETSWNTEGSKPSSVTVTGTVRDPSGRPVAGATLSIPGLGVTATSDASGAFALTGGGGGPPLEFRWDPVLGSPPAALTLELHVAHQPLEVPLLAGRVNATGLDIRLLDCPDGPGTATCTPVPASSATVEILQPEVLPFVTVETPRPAGGDFRAEIRVAAPSSAPPDLERLWSRTGRKGSPPLALGLLVEAVPETGGAPVRGLASIPLDIALLRGTTVGPDLAPRSEEDPPRLVSKPRTHLAASLSPTRAGVFYVLVRPAPLTGDPSLVWPRSCRVPLALPLGVLRDRRGIDVTLAAGTTLDVGSVDLLTPGEHELRIKGWVDEFLASMRFDNGRVAGARANLRALPIRYGVAGVGEPRYGMSTPGAALGGTGFVQVGATAQDYWGTNAFADGDPPYAIFFHELGHFVHKQVVDHWLEACLWDKKWAGSEHTTWRPPTVRRVAFSEKGVRMTSFFEATADFFAFALSRHVEQVHPEMKDSLYMLRGYLAEFDTDEHAEAALHLGGCRVEGIQTTFLRNVYANVLGRSAAAAFGDFLRTADSFKNESWILRWVPARSIGEWCSMKRKHGGAGGGEHLESLARRFGVENCEAGFLVVPAAAGTRPAVTLDGTPHVLEGAQVTLGLAPGQVLTVEDGSVAVIVQRWAPGTPSSVAAASKGTTFRFLSATEVEVLVGSLAVDGPLTIVAGGRRITPRGTSSVVTVRPDGGVEVTVVEGSVEIASAGGLTVVDGGKTVRVAPSGTVTPRPPRPSGDVLAAFVGTEPPTGVSPAAPPEPAAAAPPPPPRGSAAATPVPPRAPAAQASPRRFFVILEAASSRPAVVAGPGGIRDGDRILEVHESLEGALEALRRLDGEAPAGATPPAPPSPSAAAAFPPEAGTRAVQDPLPPPAPPAGDDRLAFAAAVVPLGPSRALVAGPGGTWILEAGRGSPERARLVAVPASRAALLTGRSVTPVPVRRGGRVVDALLAYRGSRGDALLVSRAEGHPDAWKQRRLLFASQIRSRTGSVVLLPREDEGGATTGVYVYHFPSATVLYCRDLRHSVRKVPTTGVDGFPRLRTPPVAVPALRRGGATRSYLLVDGSTGRIWSVLNVRPHPLTPRIQKLGLDLRTAMAVPEGRPQVLAALPLLAVDRASDSALLADGTTGRLALLEGTGSPERLGLTVLHGTLDPAFAAGETHWEPVLLPLHDLSAFWVLDRLSGRLVVATLDRARRSVSVRPVRVGGP